MKNLQMVLDEYGLTTADLTAEELETAKAHADGYVAKSFPDMIFLGDLVQDAKMRKAYSPTK